MSVMSQLNIAMDYIDSNICDDEALDTVHRVTTYSRYHFGRLFYYIADMPLNEYIRKRKLSLAALELQQGSEKVIDIALKYGYDNPDSFTRAFRAWHGITPKAARESGAALNIFPRLNFEINVKGEEL